MAELECCVPLLKCAEGQTTFGERRFGGGEECFCVDARGLAQGVGVFRLPRVDLATSYREGVRAVEGDHRLEQFINSAGAALVLVVLVVALSLLGGVRSGFRALAASLATWVVVGFATGVGLVLGAIASPVWPPASFGAVSPLVFIGGLFAGALALFGCGRMMLEMRVGLWRVVWVHVLIAVFGVALVAARSQDAVRAQELISHAPALVRGQ